MVCVQKPRSWTSRVVEGGGQIKTEKSLSVSRFLHFKNSIKLPNTLKKGNPSKEFHEYQCLPFMKNSSRFHHRVFISGVYKQRWQKEGKGKPYDVLHRSVHISRYIRNAMRNVAACQSVTSATLKDVNVQRLERA